MESPDMNAKYQKLATEYSKLRAQNQVLKKAVVDEQEKNSQLSDLVKSQDQILRKAEQENDSLSFRNQQLTKRLTLLQEDLDQIESKSRRGKGNGDSVIDGAIADTQVFTEELSMKIQEIARLQLELAESQATYRKRESELKSRLDESKTESQKFKDMLHLWEKSASEKVGQLENERVRQEVVAQQRQIELQTLKEQVNKLKEKCNNEPFGCQQSNVVTQQEKFADLYTAVGSSSLNIPVQNEGENSSSSGSRSLVDIFDGLIQELSQSFIKFLSTYSARVNIQDNYTDLQQKLIEYLQSATTPWQSLATTYHHLAVTASEDGSIALENLKGLSDVCQQVNACVAHLRKVLPLMVHWVCEGSKMQRSTDRSGATWSAAFSRLVSSLGSLTPYITTLANQSTPNNSIPHSAQARIISMLSDRLHNLHAALKEAAVAYQKKAESEKELHSISSDADIINEGICNALSSLTASTCKMSQLFKEQVIPHWNQGASTPSTPSSPYPGTPSFNKSRTSLAGGQDDGSSAMYDSTPVSPTESTAHGDMETSLMKQLALASSKLTQLEGEREHWRLEHQLLQCKHQKEAKRVRELEKQLKGEAVSLKEDGEQRDYSSSINSATSLVGKAQGYGGASEERENYIRNHFTNRCAHLYMQLTSATSQAVLYQKECEELMKRLAVSDECRSTSDQEMDKQREKVNQLRETLQTTSRNYEEQISTMSEHLADLNEKLTTQSDEIEHLKFEVKNKKSKKL